MIRRLETKKTGVTEAVDCVSEYGGVSGAPV